MSSRPEYRWTPEGRLSALRNGVTRAEVIDALYSPQRHENRIGDLLIAVVGLTGTARVVTVVAEREGPGWPYGIIRARPADAAEIAIWRENTR